LVLGGGIGRPWTAAELRRKSWEDLQKLWWVCAKERNIMATQKIERQRLKPGYGEFESNTRYGQVCWGQLFTLESWGSIGVDRVGLMARGNRFGLRSGPSNTFLRNDIMSGKRRRRSRRLILR